MNQPIQLADLATRYHLHQMAADPLLATYHGLPIHRDELPDLSEEGEQAVRDRAASLLAQVAAVPAVGLGPVEDTTRRMLIELLQDDIDRIDLGWTGLSIDAFEYGPQVRLLYFMPRVEVRTAEEADDFLARLAKTGTFLDAAMARHLQSTAMGDTPAHCGVVAAAAQARRAAAQPVAEAHMLEPLVAQPAAIRERAEAIYRHVTVPALWRYAEGLERDIAPHARPDDRVGLTFLPGGDERYAQALRFHTTLGRLDPDQVHETGLEIIAALAEEYATIGGRCLGETELGPINHRLHHDAELQYRRPDDAVAHSQEICDRAAKAVGQVIGRLPSTPCLVKPIPPVEANGASAAFYQVPAEGRPYGVYWVNTIEPVLPRYAAEVTAFHEAAPGHHTQIGVQVELELPAFRRMGAVLSGYSEGWGLYAERLAHELGLYTGDTDLLGMLAMDSLRACRLVVDTGLHHKGWSRQQAIDYIAANAPVGMDVVEAEVDRYIVYPGQACSYMLGRLEIQRLREDATRRLGPAFDLMGFHDALLGEGAVPLTVLGTIVDRWVASRA